MTSGTGPALFCSQTCECTCRRRKKGFRPSAASLGFPGPPSWARRRGNLVRKKRRVVVVAYTTPSARQANKQEYTPARPRLGGEKRMLVSWSSTVRFAWAGRAPGRGCCLFVYVCAMREHPPSPLPPSFLLETGFEVSDRNGEQKKKKGGGGLRKNKAEGR